jgi:hypothetical protein
MCGIIDFYEKMRISMNFYGARITMNFSKRM